MESITQETAKRKWNLKTVLLGATPAKNGAESERENGSGSGSENGSENGSERTTESGSESGGEIRSAGGIALVADHGPTSTAKVVFHH